MKTKEDAKDNKKRDEVIKNKKSVLDKNPADKTSEDRKKDSSNPKYK